mgnify:CR=1 FL=1
MTEDGRLRGLRDDTEKEIANTLEFIEQSFDDAEAYWQHQGRLSELRILLPKLDALLAGETEEAR